MANRRRPYFQLIAFSDEEESLLRRAAKQKNATYQSIIHGAAMDAIRKILGDEDELKRLAENNGKGIKPKVRGLGIRDRLKAEEQEQEEEARSRYEPAPSQVAPAITINMPSSASSGSDIPTLARGIVEAPRYQRRRLVEAAVTRIQNEARNIDEAKQTAAQLDEEIARLESKGTAIDRLRARRRRS